MPFGNVKKEEPKRSFEAIDEIVCGVFPNLDWRNYGTTSKYIYLLPCIKSIYEPDHKDPTLSKDPREFMVVGCLEKGLSFAETGLWLDYCLGEHIVVNSDGLKRQITAESSRGNGFDQRKPNYSFEGTYRNMIVVRVL